MPPPPARKRPLSIEEQRFVEEYLIDLNPPKAAIRAGLPSHRGSHFLSIPRVQAAVAALKGRRLTRLQIYQDEQVRRWALLASADATELAPIHRVACRHCYGEDFDYQYTQAELREAQREHAMRALRNPNDPEYQRPFDIKGGAGYDQTALPNPECPECRGEGTLRVIIRDTRTLSEGARLLYDGVKQGPNGLIELKLRDRSRAEEMLGRHANMFGERKSIETITDSQLDDMIVRLVERGTVEIEALASDVPIDQGQEEEIMASGSDQEAETGDHNDPSRDTAAVGGDDP